MNRFLLPIASALMFASATMFVPVVAHAAPQAAAPAMAPAKAAPAMAPAKAAPVRCHDAKGKFIKCPTAAASKPKQCRNDRGKFIKCPA